jgi:hypothetical protein
MVAFNNLPGNAGLLTGQVGNPAASANNDGDFPALSMSRDRALHTVEIHGKWYTAARRGVLFIASTALAGVTIPVDDATQLASTAGIVNPLGSGVNCELVAIGINNTTVGVAVKPNTICFQKNLSTSGGPPTSVTALTAHALPLSSGAAVAKCVAHSAATFTNAAEMAPRLNILGTLQTAVGEVTGWYKFDGEIVFGPDTAMAIVNDVTAIAGQKLTYIWAEWPAG